MLLFCFAIVIFLTGRTTISGVQANMHRKFADATQVASQLDCVLVAHRQLSTGRSINCHQITLEVFAALISQGSLILVEHATIAG